jgi:hypothetical protein
MIEFWTSVALASGLLVFFLRLVLLEKSERERLDSESNLPLEQRIPRQFKNLQAVESQLWSAEEHRRANTWETASLRLRQTELKLVTDYVKGLREDFRRGDNIFGAVILHSPNIDILRELESQRLRLSLMFHVRFMVISFRLMTNSISVKELRRLTDIVATLTYEVRTVLATLEAAGHGEFVRSVLKRS